MDNRSSSKQLLTYISTSAGALFVTYLYNVVDGIFVGRGIGPLALAAVNITVPYITVLAAVSVLLAMGGSTIIAIRLGEGNIKKANEAFMNTFVLTIITSFILLLAGVLFPRQIALLCGSSNTALPMASEYLFYYTAFSIPFIFSNCISIFVRNDGAPRLAFIGMCVGAVSNIVLDWLFIFPLDLGLKGAAIASGLGQIFACAILMSHFIRKNGQLRIQRFHFSKSLSLEILQRGIPECLSQLNTPVTALCFNWVLRNIHGDVGVATFSILSFIFAVVNSVLSGVAQGLQPLWGQAYGRGDSTELTNYFRTGLRINFLSSVVICLFLYIFQTPVVRLFSTDEHLIQMTSAALPSFSISFLLMSINLIYTAYFYSTKQTGKSDFIALSRSVVVKAISIFVIPALLGSSYVWYSAAIAELITLILCILFDYSNKQSIRRQPYHE